MTEKTTPQAEGLHSLIDELDELASDMGYEANQAMDQQTASRALLIERGVQALKALIAPGAAAAAPGLDAEAAVLQRVIQRLNHVPYNLTKAECIAEVQIMRDVAAARSAQQGAKA